MDEFKFRTLEELYRRLLPAFNTKVADLKRQKIYNVSEIDIWNYLKTYYWRNKKDLTLGEMVNDILSTPSDDLITFVMHNKKKEVKENITVL